MTPAYPRTDGPASGECVGNQALRPLVGQAVSHGSIRVANEVALDLAEMLLKAGGAWEGPEWFRQMTENRNEEYQVDLPDTIPIEVRE